MTNPLNSIFLGKKHAPEAWKKCHSLPDPLQCSLRYTLCFLPSASFSFLLQHPILFSHHLLDLILSLLCGLLFAFEAVFPLGGHRLLHLIKIILSSQTFGFQVFLSPGPFSYKSFFLGTFLASTSVSASYNFAERVAHLGWPSQLSVQVFFFLKIFCLSTNAQRFSLDLFPFRP